MGVFTNNVQVFDMQVSQIAFSCPLFYFVSVFSRPHVRQLTSFGKLTEAKEDHESGSFFIYVGPLSDSEQLYVSGIYVL